MYIKLSLATETGDRLLPYGPHGSARLTSLLLLKTGSGPPKRSPKDFWRSPEDSSKPCPAMRPIGQEPISCFRSERQLDVQVTPPGHDASMSQGLPPIQPLMLSVKQGGTGSHFYSVFGMTRPGIEPPTSQSQGGHSNHKATELVIPLSSTSLRH